MIVVNPSLDLMQNTLGESSGRVNQHVAENGSDHRAAGVIVASKHAMPAASGAAHCYTPIA